MMLIRTGFSFDNDEFRIIRQAGIADFTERKRKSEDPLFTSEDPGPIHDEAFPFSISYPNQQAHDRDSLRKVSRVITQNFPIFFFETINEAFFQSQYLKHVNFSDLCLQHV